MSGRRRPKIGRLTSRQLDVLVDYVATSSFSETARNLGMREQTAKNHLYEARRNHDVETTFELLTKLGWIHVPIEEEREFARLRARLVELREEVVALLARFRLTPAW